MKIVDAVNLAYREARERGELDYPAFERAVAAYRERRPDAQASLARFQVARMIGAAAYLPNDRRESAMAP